MATEHGISYREEMILCKLDGSKNTTRRVLKTQPGKGAEFDHFDPLGRVVFTDGTIAKHTYGVPGDWLYVKESYCVVPVDQFEMVAYKATPRLGLRVPGVLGAVDFMTYLDESTEMRYHALGYPLQWKSSRFMFKKYARIKDCILSFGAERLQQITDDEVLAEGMTIEKVAGWLGLDVESVPTLRDAFRLYWDHINKDRGFGWADNPWVLVIKSAPVPREEWMAVMGAPLAMAAEEDGEEA